MDTLNLLFVTSVDLSGSEGPNIATAHVVKALAQNPESALTVVCPEPAHRLALPGLEGALDGARFLPRRPKSGKLAWHATVQMHMYRALRELIPRLKPDVMVARLGPALLPPPLLTKRLDIPYILLVRGLLVRNFRDLYSLPMVYYTELVSRMNARAASKVYAAFDEAKQWIDGYRSPGQEPSEVLPNATDPYLFQPMSIAEARQRVALNLDESDFVVGFVGGVHKRHGLVPLLQAFSRFRDESTENTRLLIVGEGPQRTELEDLVRQEGLQDSVFFTGFIPHTKVPSYVAACDIMYGIADPDFVSNPIKCYEYLACERPIVTSQNKTLSFVQEQEVGTVLTSLEPAEIAAAIQALNLAGQERRLAMGRRGRQYILEHHTWERFAETVVDGARRLLDSESAG